MKLKKIRIFLKDDKNKYYRICSISNQKDYTGEYYLKIMFPDIKGIPLITGHHNKGVVKLGEGLIDGIQEFTYHYRSGISHFKNFNGHIDTKRNMPTLFDHQALHLLRYIIRSLTIFEIQDNSKISSTDFVLPISFGLDPRGFEFAISRIVGPWSIVNEQGQDSITTYKIPLEDQNVSLHVSDGVWRRPPMGKLDTLFEIFTHDDPATAFSFTPFKK